MRSHIILIDCPDEKGIVYKVTGVLYDHGLNIEYQGEFVDKTTKHFFMRTEVTGDFDQDSVRSSLHEVTPRDSSIELSEHKKKDIVVLVTKEPHCLGDLLVRHDYGELHARILAVVSNREHLRPLVEKFSLPFHLVPHEGISRTEHESRMLKVLEQYEPRYIVLAKYMRILSDSFVSRYSHRIINIHHSFLPAFVGAKPYHRAHERGVKIIGATAHFVTPELDEGPIIAQDVIPVDHTKSISDMVRAGRNVEKIVLANALRLVFEDRVFVRYNRTVIFD